MKKRVSKLAALGLIIAMLASLIACSGPGTSNPAPSSSNAAPAPSSSAATPSTTEAGPDPDRPLKIAMCLEIVADDFYIPCKVGGEDAAKEDGNTEVYWLGPQSADATQLLSIIDTQIQSGIDGLCIQAGNPDSLRTVVDKAHEKGIPVMLFNNTKEFDGYDGSVGMQPKVAGEGIAKQIETILSGDSDWSAKLGIEKGATPSGKIAFFLNLPGSWNQEGRIAAAKEYLAKYSGIEDLGTYDITVQGTAYAMSVVENVITANPDVRVLMSACAPATQAAAQVVQNLGLQDQILVIGMDTLEKTLQLVKEGALPMAINQDPYNQGYLPVKYIIEYIREGKEIPKVTSTELKFIYADGVDAFLEYEKEIRAKS